MGKIKADEQLVALWVHLHQKGRSFRSIAAEYGVDPRTVRAWVVRAGREKDREHWEAVSRQVDARYLEEHYRLLVLVAVALLEVVHTDPVSPHQAPAAAELVKRRLQAWARQAEGLLKERGLDLVPPRPPDRRAARAASDTVDRLGRKLLDALLEHEPELGRAVTRWERCWAEFQEARGELVGVAGSLLRHRGVPAEASQALKPALVWEAMASRLQSREPLPFRVEPLAGEQWVLLGHIEEAGTRLWKGSQSETEALRSACDTVLQQVAHQERVRPVENAYHRLVDCVREVEDLVDRLVLVGKPQGRCPLCLNHSMQLSYL